jgi:hypothetical protein
MCEVLELVVSFPTSPSSLNTELLCILYCVFEFGGFTGSFLREVFTSPYLVFYLLLLIGLYGLHWIDISLSFSKIPSLLKSESGRKSSHRFRLPSFLVGANPASPGFSPGGQLKPDDTGLYTGRPVSTRRHRPVYRVARRRARYAPVLNRNPSLGGIRRRTGAHRAVHREGRRRAR